MQIPENLTNKQQELLDRAIAALGSKLEVVKWMVKRFEISQSSAYRRMNCEQLLDIVELNLMQQEFGNLKHTFNGGVGVHPEFTLIGVSKSKFVITEQWKLMGEFMDKVAAIPGAHMFHVAANLPLFMLFSSKKLTALHHYWSQRVVLENPKFLRKPFILKHEIEDPAINIAQVAWQKYLRISSTELWTRYTLETMLDKIVFLRKHNLLDRKSDEAELFVELEEMLERVATMAENGYKRNDEKVVFKLSSYEGLHFNNYAIINSNELRGYYLMHNVNDLLFSTNEQFIERELRKFDRTMVQAMPLGSSNKLIFQRILSDYRKKLYQTRKEKES